MRVKVLTLRYSPTLGGFDERPIQDLTRDKDVLSFREHFFTVEGLPHLGCVITWQDRVIEPETLALARELADDRAADEGRRAAHAPLRPSANGGGNSSLPSMAAGSAPRRKDRLVGLDERQRALFNTLRAWRSEKARQEGVPAYVIFTDQNLVELVTRIPSSRTELGHIPGIGPKAVERHGEAVLRILLGVRGAEDAVASAGARAGEDACENACGDDPLRASTGSARTGEGGSDGGTEVGAAEKAAVQAAVQAAVPAQRAVQAEQALQAVGGVS